MPRWSHRDPVEGGNPFPQADSRWASWDAATRRAREELVRFDAEMQAGEDYRGNTDPYPVRVVALAAARFDVWAQRALCGVRSEDALRDYEAWLDQYLKNWLTYVRETCPKIDVDESMRARLRERVASWTHEARKLVRS